jgi:ABC-type uncharacterized transport system substrate-binding protein
VRKGLQEAGLVEGVNYAFALRFADGVFDWLPGLALELAALKPRIIVASAAAAITVHKVVPDLPMVFTSYAADPIKASNSDGVGALYVEQASKFTLVVNAGTAKQLGTSVPPTLLTLADEVIE